MRLWVGVWVGFWRDYLMETSVMKMAATTWRTVPAPWIGLRVAVRVWRKGRARVVIEGQRTHNTSAPESRSRRDTSGTSNQKTRRSYLRMDNVGLEVGWRWVSCAT